MTDENLYSPVLLELGLSFAKGRWPTKPTTVTQPTLTRATVPEFDITLLETSLTLLGAHLRSKAAHLRLQARQICSKGQGGRHEGSK